MRVIRTAVGLGILLVAAFVLHRIWLGGPRSAYEAKIAELRAQGIPVRLEELAQPVVPDEQNAALVLEEVARRIEERMAAHDRWTPVDVVENTDEEEKWTDDDWAKLRAHVASLEPCYEVLRGIETRPSWNAEVDWGEGVAVLPKPIVWIGPVADMLRHRAEYGEDEDPTQRAAESVLAGLTLAERFRPHFGLGYGVRGSLLENSAAIVKAAMGREGFDAKRFRELVDERLAKAVDPTGPPAEVFRSEFAYGLEVYGRWIAGDLNDLLILQGEPWWRRNWIGRPTVYQDAVAWADAMLAVLPECDTSPEAAHRFLRSYEPDAEFLSAPAVWACFHTYVETVAVLRLLRVVLALLEAHQDTGAWPASLDELDFPGGLPTDPFTGAPFVYERTDTGVRIHAREPDCTFEDMERNRLAWSLGR